MGESVIEATITRWIKQEGEPVTAGEPVVELETDKVSLEVGAQQAGTLQRIQKQAGDTVVVGDILAFVDPAGAQAPAAAPADQGAGTTPAAPVSSPEPEPQPPKEPATAVGAATAAAAASATPAPSNEAPTAAAASLVATATAQAATAASATPVAQRMALDLGVDLSKIQPSGAGGKITKEDVAAYAEKSKSAPAPAEKAPQPPVKAPSAAAPAPAAPPAAAGDHRETRQRMSRRRQTIARRLVEVHQTAAMLTTFNEIDMSAVMDLRKRRREAFKERYSVDLGFMSFFVKASIGALKAFPTLNAEIQGDEIVLKHYYDIGVAVGSEEGLVVPVLRDADRLNFAGIEKAIREFITRVKSGTLTLEDLRGGTFTITNGGVFGSLMSTPILNPPQVGILGMHKIQERPVVVNGEIVIRPMMYVALSYDHRLVDGREAVQFLVRLKELVEDPESLLFG
jgi:2-oxoglutarate dehydrogenase E2 component (dihydrolipoamide succinyltransferase)